MSQGAHRGVMIQSVSTGQAVVVIVVGVLIAVLSAKALISGRYLQHIAVKAVRYSFRSFPAPEAGRLIPLIRALFGLSAVVGIVLVVIGVLALTKAVLK